MIKREMEIKNKVTAKGILKCVDDAGLHIEDTKSGEVETLSMDALKMFIDKEIAFSVADSTKMEKEIDDEVENDEDMEDEE
jgi:hypothetical protein